MERTGSGRVKAGTMAPALVAGLLLRAMFVWGHPRFAGDTLVYGDLAQNLLRHHTYGLTEDHVRSTLIRLPGYPLFLAACFAVFGVGNYLPVVWVQVLVDLLGCVLLADVARRLFGERVGLWALWLAALCPFTANYSAAPLTETGSIFCVVLALWGLVRFVQRLRAGQRVLGAAMCVGVAITGATLLRPDGGLLAAAVVPAMLWAGWQAGARRWRAVGGAVLASAMLCGALGLWAVRNWRVFHVVQPLAPKYANDPGEAAPLGFARWYRTWAVGFGDTVRVYWAYDGSLLSMGDLPRWAFDSPAQRAETEALVARYNAESASTPAVEAAFAQLAETRVRAHPVRFYVLLPLAKLGDMWLRPRTELFGRHTPLRWWDVRVRPRAALFAWAYGALNLALLGCAVAGLWRWRRAGWGGYGVVAGAAVGFALLRSGLLLTIDNSEPRYVLECYPVVVMLAAVGLVGEWRARRG